MNEIFDVHDYANHITGSRSINGNGLAHFQ